MTVFIYCETLHYDKLNIVVQVPNLSSKESMHTYIHTYTPTHTHTNNRNTKVFILIS